MVAKINFLGMIEELNEIAEKDFEETERKMSQNPNYEKIMSLRKEAAACWKSKEYVKAIAIFQDACVLEPLLKDELSSMKSYYSHKKKVGKVNFKKSVKKIIFPKVEILGFIFDENFSSGGSFSFTRKIDKREQEITIGRDKFGHMFGLTAFKEEKNGEYVPFNLVEHEVSTNMFEYLNQEELDKQLQAVVELIDNKLIPWFEAE